MNPAETSGFLNREARGGFGLQSAGVRILQRLGPQQDPNLDRVLASVGTVALAAPVVCPFEVKIPDPSVQVRLALAIAPKTPISTDASVNAAALGTTGATLWTTLRSRAVSNQPQFIPTRNLVGTGAAPITIPTDTRLWGFEFEVSTVGQNVRGELAVTAGTATAAYEWHLIVEYASIENMSDAEWRALANMAGIVRGDKTLIAGGT